MSESLAQIAALLTVGLVWLFLNLRAGPTWLKFVSIVAALAFLFAASWLALDFAGVTS